MKVIRMKPLAALLLVLLTIVSSATAQQRGPAFDFEAMLDTWFSGDNGLLRLGDYVVAFAPEGQFRGQAAVINDRNEVKATFEFFPDYVLREGVFGKVRVVGPADVQLTEPGTYFLIFLVDGQPVSRLPFVLKQTGAGDDPFNPQKTYAFDGYWRTTAHLTMTAPYEPTTPMVNFWVGGLDLPAGATKDTLFLELLRDGAVVAHSKHTSGHVAAGHFKRQALPLFHPHERKNANPDVFTLADWLVDGKHELRVTRGSDSTVIRSFDFEVRDGRFAPLPQTDMAYEPAFDYMVPRVVRKHGNTFEMIEAVWIQDR